MGMDLKPVNEDVDEFYIGTFSWIWMLQEGVGLILSYSRGIKPGTWIGHEEVGTGALPHTNDGFFVDADHAKAMAMAARGLVACYQGIQEAWDEWSPEARAEAEKHPEWRLPIREDFLTKVSQFADFADKSGGFSID